MKNGKPSHNFKTYSEARRCCEKYGIKACPSDIFMVADGLAGAFFDGNKRVTLPILKTLEAYLKLGAKIVWQDEAWHLFDPKGESLAYGETISDLLVSLIMREC